MSTALRVELFRGERRGAREMELSEDEESLVEVEGLNLTEDEIRKIHFFWYCSEGWCDRILPYLERKEKVTTRAWMLSARHTCVYELFFAHGYTPKPSVLPYVISGIEKRKRMSYWASTQVLLQQLPNVNLENNAVRKSYDHVLALSGPRRRPATKNSDITALAAAVMIDSIELVQQLLQLGANVNQRISIRQHSVLHYVGSVEMAQFLLQNDADPLLMDSDHNTVLHEVVDLDILAVFLPLCDVHHRNKRGKTPILTLLLSRERNFHLRRLQLLVEHGANVNDETRTGVRPLDLYRDKIGCVEYLRGRGAITREEALVLAGRKE